MKTTQYMSHGVNWAGSDVLRALYEAKMGKRNEVMELLRVPRLASAWFSSWPATGCDDDIGGAVGTKRTYESSVAKRSNMAAMGRGRCEAEPLSWKGSEYGDEIRRC